MQSNTIPTIAVGADVKFALRSKDTCYYFCSFEKALELLRRGKTAEPYVPKAETPKEEEEGESEDVLPPMPTTIATTPIRRRIEGSRTINIVGNTYNWLTVIAFAGVKGRTARWLCRCKCGKEKIVDGNNLKSGTTKSCGCMQKQMASELGKANNKNLLIRKKDGSL